MIKLSTIISMLFALKFCDKICFRFNGHFPGESGLAGIRMSPFWIPLELRVMEEVVTTGAIRCAKLKSKRQHQQTNTQFFYRPDALPVAQPNSVIKYRNYFSNKKWELSIRCMSLPNERICSIRQLMAQ